MNKKLAISLVGLMCAVSIVVAGEVADWSVGGGTAKIEEASGTCTLTVDTIAPTTISGSATVSAGAVSATTLTSATTVTSTDLPSGTNGVLVIDANAAGIVSNNFFELGATITIGDDGAGTMVETNAATAAEFGLRCTINGETYFILLEKE